MARRPWRRKLEAMKHTIEIRIRPGLAPAERERRARARGCYMAASPALAAVLRDDFVAAYERAPVAELEPCLEDDPHLELGRHRGELYPKRRWHRDVG